MQSCDVRGKRRAQARHKDHAAQRGPHAPEGKGTPLQTPPPQRPQLRRNTILASALQRKSIDSSPAVARVARIAGESSTHAG